MRYAVLFLCANVFAAEYWVSPTGSDENAGTYAAPWALTKICRTTRGASPISAVSAGDTVWMRGGTYAYNQGLFCDLVGTAEAYITVRAVAGESPVVTASHMGFPSQLNIGGSYVQFIGIWAAYTGPKIGPLGGTVSTFMVPTGWNISEQLLGKPTGVRLINCWSHGDSGTISATSSDHQTLYYGGIHFDQGDDGPDRLHSGWMYQQNDGANGWETAKHNVSLLAAYYYNFRIYTTAGKTQKLLHDGNLVIGGANFYQSADADGADITIKNSMFVTRESSYAFAVGVALTPPARLTVENNDIIRHFRIWGADSPAITGNRIEGRGTWDLELHNGSGAVVENNEFAGYACVSYYGASCQAGAEWTANCGALAAAGNTCTGSPSGNWVRTYANEYEAGRGHVAVYNWTGATSQSVDVSTFMSDGDRWEALDLWTPLSPAVASGTVSDGTITLPLTGTDYYTPWGMGAAGNAARPKACWEVDRANCLTSGDYVVAASVGELPAGTYTYQPALLSSNYAVYYWSGSAWTSAGVTMATHAGPTYQREPNAHVFLVRRVYDSRPWTTVSWRGTASGLRAGYKKPNGEYSWELPVIGASCTDGLCSARVPQAVGDAYIEVNGTAMKMRAL